MGDVGRKWRPARAETVTWCLSALAEFVVCFSAEQGEQREGGPREFLGFFPKTLRHVLPAVCLPLSFLITTARGTSESERKAGSQTVLRCVLSS